MRPCRNQRDRRHASSTSPNGTVRYLVLDSLQRTKSSEPAKPGPVEGVRRAGIRRAVLEQRPKMLFLTSPNNPDGSLISEAELLELLALPVLVVLDEAYIEFCGEPSRLGWVARYDNLVVLRTFSKSAGLAGAAFGSRNVCFCALVVGAEHRQGDRRLLGCGHGVLGSTVWELRTPVVPRTLARAPALRVRNHSIRI